MTSLFGINMRLRLLLSLKIKNKKFLNTFTRGSERICPLLAFLNLFHKFTLKSQSCATGIVYKKQSFTETEYKWSTLNVLLKPGLHHDVKD